MLIKKLSDQVNEYACALAEVTKELHLLQTKRVPTAALSTSACEARAQATANVQSKQPPSAQTFQSADFEICSEDPAVVTNDWASMVSTPNRFCAISSVEEVGEQPFEPVKPRHKKRARDSASLQTASAAVEVNNNVNINNDQ